MSVTPELAVGERVRVAFDATVHHIVDDVVIFLLTSAHWTISLSSAAVEHLAITRLEPADGEPQPGDLWIDTEGVIRAAVAATYTGVPQVGLVNTRTGAYAPWRDVHTGLTGPIRLLHRPDTGGA
jgi:hypothetical protein